MRYLLNKTAIKAVHAAIEQLYDRAKLRLMGKRGNKEIRVSVTKPVGVRADLTVPALYRASAEQEGFKGSDAVEHSLNSVVEGYMDAHKELAKVRVVKAVQDWLLNAETQGVRTDAHTVLGGELTKLFGELTHNVKKIVGTETTKARNMGSLDAVSRIAAISSESDPNVYFAIVKDDNVCAECVRLHQLNGTLGGPPKVYKMSEIGHGYHKKGESQPKVGGLHPHCRCTLCKLAKGFGFNEGGQATFISLEHDEYAVQQGFKSEE